MLTLLKERIGLVAGILGLLALYSGALLQIERKADASTVQAIETRVTIEETRAVAIKEQLDRIERKVDELAKQRAPQERR